MYNDKMLTAQHSTAQHSTAQRVTEPKNRIKAEKAVETW